MDQATLSNPPDDRLEQGSPSQELSENGTADKTTGGERVEDPSAVVGLISTGTEPRTPHDVNTNATATPSHEPENYALRTFPEVTTENETPDPATDPQVESNSSQNGLAGKEEQKA